MDFKVDISLEISIPSNNSALYLIIPELFYD